MNSKSASSSSFLIATFRFLFVTIAGVVIFISALAALFLWFEKSYTGYIYPGISLGGTDLSNLSIDQAISEVSSQNDYPFMGKIIFTDNENLWVAYPGQLGFVFPAEHNGYKAYNVGREMPLVARLSTFFTAWRSGIKLTPDYIYDQRAALEFLQDLELEINQPAVEAALSINGTEVVALPGVIGRSLDIQATLGNLSAPLGNLIDFEVPLVINEFYPEIMDVSEQAAIAEEILSEPLIIQVPKSLELETSSWTFEPDSLAEMITIEKDNDPAGAAYRVGLSTDNLRAFISSIAPRFVRQHENARFIFNDDTRELDLLTPSTIGQSLDIETTIKAINEALFSGEHTVTIDIEYTNPAATDEATAESLGISELVSNHTSYFYGSSASRIQNIITASERFHGVLVAPGATFSMAELLGDVSLDTGYAEAWIIYGNRTIKGVGGGVCQVSTTLFRTVFFGGYPIIERYPHAYRVYYYEQRYGGGVDTGLAGLDATVYAPLVDFKFTNDTENWLLMETYVNAVGRSLTWKFYSTTDGRSVEWESSGLTNKQDAPEPLYVETSDLAKGDIEQVDWAVEGADVVVTRFVWRDDEIIHDDIFSTHYQPWRAICNYGPGTKGMPPAKPDPDRPCKPVTKNGN